MLKFLSITNFAVIRRLSFELEPGLNLFTGETGAGKSIIVDALGLLLGNRSASEQVRTGEPVATIEGVFELSGQCEQKVRQELEGVGIAQEEQSDLVIRREVQAQGRNRVFINDHRVTTATLKKLRRFLVEIYGQGEQQMLTAASFQRELLDSFAGVEDLRREVGQTYTRWREALEALHNLERDETTRRRASEMLRFQIEEIARAAPRVGEDEELQVEKSLLVNAERRLALSEGAYTQLYESDQSILTQLAVVRRALQSLRSIDGRVEPLLEGLEASTLTLTDVAGVLRGYASEIESAPHRLGEIENRLAELERLKRKYSLDLGGLIAAQELWRRQLNQLEDVTGRERELDAEVAAAAQLYQPLVRRLSALRRAAVPSLERRVLEELRQVALERAQFAVSLKSSETELRPTAPLSETAPMAAAGEAAHAPVWGGRDGADQVEFMFSANEGESLRPLGGVASGGELARLMLALRTAGRRTEVTAIENRACGTIVFDEIDTGIGGRVAEAVGRRLKSLAADQQVICVTHQTQIARYADQHYAVMKYLTEGRTETAVKRLSQEERVRELARMIGGAENIGVTQEAARWMLEEGWSDGAASPPRRVKSGLRSRQKATKKGS